jgi:hypothetical protein
MGNRSDAAQSRERIVMRKRAWLRPGPHNRGFSRIPVVQRGMRSEQDAPQWCPGRD